MPPYINHRSPTPRPTDTPIGKIVGYLAELQFYINLDGECGKIDALWPFEFWPLSLVDDWFMNMLVQQYNAQYQEVYNHGADKGNQINGEIMAWMTELENKMRAKIDEVNNYIQNTLIAPLQSKVNEMSSRVNDIQNRTNKATSDLNALTTRMQDAQTQLQDHLAKINDLYERVKKLEAESKQKMPLLEQVLGKVGI